MNQLSEYDGYHLVCPLFFVNFPINSSVIRIFHSIFLAAIMSSLLFVNYVGKILEMIWSTHMFGSL